MTIKDYTEYKEAEILRLYAEVGWTAYTDAPDTLRKGFENSLLTLAAYEGTTLLGLVRAVGDGHTIIFCAGYSGASGLSAAGNRLCAAAGST